MGLKIWDLKTFGFENLEFENFELKVWTWKFWGLKAWILELEMWDLKIWNVELRTRYLELNIWCWDIIIVLLCDLVGIWALYDWSCCNLGFGAFLKCCVFGHGVTRTRLVIYGILAMLIICDVVGWTLAWILGALALWKICCVGLVEFIHDECGRFVGMCNLWQNFVGMSMEKFCGHRKIFVEVGKFYGHEILAMEKKNIFVRYVMFNHGKFLWF